MIHKSTSIGKTTVIFHPELVNLYGCVIGEHCKIASFVEIQEGVRIGSNVKIEAFVFIPTGVTIEDNVFIGPHVCFINDRYPEATTKDGTLKEKADWKLEETYVHTGASLGAGSIILCGVSIGEHAIIGAGSVVTKDVPKGKTVRGIAATHR